MWRGNNMASSKGNGGKGADSCAGDEWWTERSLLLLLSAWKICFLFCHPQRCMDAF